MTRPIFAWANSDNVVGFPGWAKRPLAFRIDDAWEITTFRNPRPYIPAPAPFAAYVEMVEDQEEAAVREMLGRWVSETEPTLVYRGGKLIGLTIADIPVGVVAPIVVERI